MSDGIVPELKPHVASIRPEQFIYELAQHDEDTGQTQEAEVDIVSESPKPREIHTSDALSTLKSGW